MNKPVGLGQRLIARIKAKGYADPGAKFGIAVTRFALDHRYPPGFVYKWVSEEAVPSHESMVRLAKDLEVTAGWLHYGDEPVVRARKRPLPVAGGAHADQPLPVAEREAIVAEVLGQPLSLVNQDVTRDIMSSQPRAIHHLWGSTKELTHYWCLGIRQSMLRDRLGLRAA